MHFVEIAIEPIEEATDAIPLTTVIFIFRFALHDELKLFFLELRPCDVGANLMLFGGSLEVAKTFAVDLALEGADGALVDRKAVVGYDQTVVDLNNTPEASTFGTGAKGGVKGEERWSGRAEALACDWRAEPVSKVCDRLYICIEYLNTTFAKMEGLLRSFDEPGARFFVHARDAILHDQ